MMEDISLIDAVHIREASEHSERVKRALDNTESPDLLRVLIDYYLTKGSKGALKILTTLKSSHAQDFFDKLHECIHVKATRLGVLRLLAFALNSQMSWLYKLSAHPLFSSILQYLRESQDIVVLTTSALVVAALVPLIPSYLGGRLVELMDIFYNLATIRATHTLENVPSQLYPHLDAAVYYLFIQLYSLFPINLVHSLQQKVQVPIHLHNFQEHIAPLFRYVQLHPHLVTGIGLAFETSKERWRSLEPHDIATLGLSISLDPSLQGTGGGADTGEGANIGGGADIGGGDTLRKPCSYSDEGPGLTVFIPEPGSSNTKHIVGVPLADVSVGTSRPVPPSDTPLCGHTSGVLTSSQLQEVCRKLHHGYDNTFGLSTHSNSSSVAVTTPASPPSEPANSDERAAQAQAYSPTASVGDTESLLNRQVTHSGSHASVGHASVGHASVGHASVGHASVGHASVGHASVGHASVGHASAKDNVASLGERSVQTLPVIATGPARSMVSLSFIPPQGSLRANIEKLFNGLLSYGSKATPTTSSTETEVGKDCLEDHQNDQGNLSHDDQGDQSHDDQSDLSHDDPGDQSRDDQGDQSHDDQGDQSHDDQGDQSHDDQGDQSHDGQGDQSHDDQGDQSHDDQGDQFHNYSYDAQDLGIEIAHSNQKCYHVEVDGEDTRSVEHGRSYEGLNSTGTERGQGERPLKRIRQDMQVTSGVGDMTGGGVARPISTTTHLLSSGGGSHGITSAPHLNADLSPRPHYRRVLMGDPQGCVQCPDPSPLELLNRLLVRGEVVHRGAADSIPITETEGMDWMHFGGCPHLEEVGIMQSQVALLHSQLLFERYQCVQHAVRSRLLLCKSRCMDKAQEEVASLKEQVSCQKELIQSMQSDYNTRIIQMEEQCKKMEDSNRHLASVNTSLASKSQYLGGEVQRLEKMNAELSQELLKTRSELCYLQTQLCSMEGQLRSTRHLQSEVDRLSHDLLMLGEAHQHLRSSLALRRKDTHPHQWDLERSVLLREKDIAQTSMLTLLGELRGLQMQVRELQQRLGEKDKQIGTLLKETQIMQAQCHEKIKATENKYQTLVVISQQLHAHIMELKGRPLPKKKPSHKRCKSQPTVS